MSALSPERWLVLWQTIGAGGDGLIWFDRLKEAYSEPQRHYHNQQHISECLTEFDSTRHLAADPDAVELALWFHDAVYNPRAPDNEEKSAQLAAQCLRESGLAGAIVEKVAGLVMATKSHHVGDDTDTALVVDVDLSILGQSDQRFWEYEAQIREEYAWVPRIIFGRKRATILEQSLGREHLYTIGWFRQKYEERARLNLTESIRRLRRLFV